MGVWVHDGEVPYAADRVAIVFSRVGDGTVLRVDATPTSLVGRWEATVELPAGGTWVLAADISGPDFAGSLTLDPSRWSRPRHHPPGRPRPRAGPSCRGWRWPPSLRWPPRSVVGWWPEPEAGSSRPGIAAAGQTRCGPGWSGDGCPRTAVR